MARWNKACQRKTRSPEVGSASLMAGPGSGAALKLVVNLALGAAIVALGESLAFGESLGLERGTLLDVLADSPIGPAVESKRESIQSGRYPPRFKLSLAAKDLRLVTDAADTDGLDLRLARAARDWLEQAAERGAADLDYSAVVAVILGEDARS